MIKLIALTIVVLFSFFTLSQSPQMSFTEKLEGVATTENELTKNAHTDNGTIGQAGRLSTSVPLVTVKSRTMSFPIGLSYTSGITANQESGSVGLGWVLPIGSIMRDYGAFEPDYTSTSGELLMQSPQGGQNGWLNPMGSAINVSTNYESLGYTTLDNSNMDMPLSDEYHVSIPGFGSNTFWNGGGIGGAYNWKWNDYSRWKVEPTVKTFQIDQEYSRINEFNMGQEFPSDKTRFDINGSYAAAIGVLPYVMNGEAFLPSNTFFDQKVKYEDFESFIVTDDNGMVYVFGRPLRGQKYVFTDNPFWSASSDIDYYTTSTTTTENGTTTTVSPPANSPKGNFWKIDYIAEWLLTEIHSPDYEDLNGNGIADDGDAGDWIRFEYTEATKQIQTIPTHSNQFATSTVPKYREWSTFSQTDQASSLMRELAYLQRIVTPTQILDFTISERMDIDHDFFDKPANKRGDIFYYEDRKCSSSGNLGSVNDFDIKYPVETMKYDSIKVFSKLIDKSIYTNESVLTGAIVLNYAEKGSPQELAVSDYTIRNNDNTPKLNQDGTHLGTPSKIGFDLDDYNNGDKRGKTTLLSIDFLGDNLDANKKTSYKFEYGYNPSYSEIHKREIIRKWTSPSLRQSGFSQPNSKFDALMDYDEIVLNQDGISTSIISHSGLNPDEFLIDFPYEENYYKYSNLTVNQSSDFIHNQTSPSNQITVESVVHPLEPVVDLFGYLYAENCSECPKAWSLTKVIYPTGGQVSYDYEKSTYNPNIDKYRWSFNEETLPFIGEYNELAKERSLSQDVYNVYCTNSANDYYSGWSKKKTLTATYEIAIPEYYGIRLKRKDVFDNSNPLVEIQYDYGTSHFSSMPAEVIARYYGGFASFVRRERKRHVWEKNVYPIYQQVIEADWVSDYEEKMSTMAIYNVTLDDYKSDFFYSTTDTRYSDQSFVRNHYSNPSQNLLTKGTQQYKGYCTKFPQLGRDGRYAIGGSSITVEPIVLFKTEYFEAGNTTAYKSEEYSYTYHELETRFPLFDYQEMDNYFIIIDNVFENWVPLNPRNPAQYGLGNINLGPFTNSGSTTNWLTIGNVQNGKAFAYHLDNLVYGQIHVQTNVAIAGYEKWGTTKLILDEKKTTYKGLETIFKPTYHPTEFYLQQESTETYPSTEVFIKKYEYGFETYATSPNNVFLEKNILNVPTRVSTHLNFPFTSTALSAGMSVYEFSSGIPRLESSYSYETNLNPDGTFLLVDFDINSASNPNWRRTENDIFEYNKGGQPISNRTSRLYSKTVMGNGLNLQKAAISNPYAEFDATYSGFEDFSGVQTFSNWTNEDYKDEDWFIEGEASQDEPAVSWRVLSNPCNNPIPQGENQPYIRELNHILIDNLSGLQVGDAVRIDLTGSSYSIPSAYSFSIETTVLNIISISGYSKDFALCVNTPIIFPESIGTPSTGVATGQGLDGSQVVIQVEEEAQLTISETKVTKLGVEYSLSNRYARTGKYSYRMPTRREAGAEYKKTPIRPVKLSASPSNSSPLSCPDIPPAPNVNNFCQWSYEASVWIKYDFENRLTGDNPPAVVKSADPLADGIYKRGTVTTTNNNQGVVIVCDIYDQSRTTILETKRFYVEQVDNDWKQYTIEIPSSRDTEKWLDVYVVNERSQLGLVALKDYKSLYADDIVIYPTGSKYAYSIFDKFGNPTYSVNNNDVYTSTTYDQKGRAVSTKNAYGTVTNTIDYFETQNWVNANNHVTLTNWIDNGVMNKTRKYVDGFGKTKQVMTVDYARNARVVNETNYFDDKGFLTATFKPYALSGTILGDNYDANFFFDVQDFYESANAFTGMSYEAKPEQILSSMVAPRENLEAPIVSSQTDYVSTAALFAPFGLTAATQNYPPGNLLIHEMQNPNGNIVRTYLDGNGRVILEEHEIGQYHVQNADGTISLTTGNTVSRTWFVYDPAGHLVRVVDPSGKQSDFFYNSLGVLVKEITPDKGTTELRYDKYGQVRFVRDQKDINASVNSFGTDQFMYTKYDAWGRVVESGQIMAATSTPPFSGQAYFDNYTSINNQNFPSNSTPLRQVHQVFDFDGSREQFDSDALLGERVYSSHSMDATFFYVPTNTDIKSFKYMADGQLAECAYTYDGLDKHKMVFNYNAMRLPVGKKYIHPTNNQFDFEWKTKLDNFGRAKVNSSVHYGIEKVTGTYKYDLLGNLLMKGLGETGNSANPSVDYVTYSLNIRDQINSQMSNNFRYGLQYDLNGNITDQFWSNEEFDPTNGANLAINQYHYYYDKMNRLIGADYREGSLVGSPSPFGYYGSIYSSIGNDFDCIVNPLVVDDYFLEKLNELSKNIPEGEETSLEQNALNALNLLISKYKEYNVSWQTMPLQQQEDFLIEYVTLLDRSKIFPYAYEQYEAIYQPDSEHESDLRDSDQYNSALMKYTRLIMSGIPFTPSVDCDPNLNATAYGFLPSFPVPSSMTNSTKYDAAYWYSENGNTTQLNRNDQFGVKTTQNYVYSNSLNNQLNQVSWTTNGNASSFGYQYDPNGNLFEDLRNDVSNIAYNTFNELPTSITNINGQKRYRYNAQGQRIMKEVSNNDIEYYMDGVIVDELGDVKSYAIPEGYVEPNLPLEKVDYYFTITDWLGTTRSVIDKNGVQLNAVDHYPFGLRMPDRNSYTTGQEGQRYQFTGHEYDGETGYDYHGARYYNRELGRYMSVDPLAKEFFGWSSYNYTMGNPINLIDPTGMGPEDIGIYTLSKDGTVSHIKTVKSEKENYDMIYKSDDWKSNEFYGNRERIDDQTILPQLVGYKTSFVENNALAKYADGKTGDLFKLFKYAADNSEVEWTIVQGKINGMSATRIGTSNMTNQAPNPFSMGVEEGSLTLDLHSHRKSAGITTSMSDEKKSMGMDVNGQPLMNATYDWHVYEGYIEDNKNKDFKYQVYFAATSRLYQVKKGRGPVYIKNINSYKDLK